VLQRSCAIIYFASAGFQFLDKFLDCFEQFRVTYTTSDGAPMLGFGAKLSSSLHGELLSGRHTKAGLPYGIERSAILALLRQGAPAFR
jgi:hypothetical protein